MDVRTSRAASRAGCGGGRRGIRYERGSEETSAGMVARQWPGVAVPAAARASAAVEAIHHQWLAIYLLRGIGAYRPEKI